MYRDLVTRKKIFIVEDHHLLVDMWLFRFQSMENCHVAGFAHTGAEALRLIPEADPDLVLLDIELPDIPGTELLKHIRDINKKIKVVVISQHMDIALVKTMMKNGASGYFTKSSPMEEIVRGLQQICFNGKEYVSSDIKDMILSTSILGSRENKLDLIQELTRRELEVIACMKEGLSSPEIAYRLFISRRTVDVHRYNIYKKLEVKNSFELIEIFRKYDKLSLLDLSLHKNMHAV